MEGLFSHKSQDIIAIQFLNSLSFYLPATIVTGFKMVVKNFALCSPMIRRFLRVLFLCVESLQHQAAQDISLRVPENL